MSRLLALALLTGCTPTTFAFSPMLKAITPKPENCVVEVMTSPPARTYQEVGTLELYNGDAPKTLDAFKKAVGKQICDVGGDVGLAIADDKGQFTKGTVLAYTGAGATPPARPGAAPEQATDTERPK